MGRPKKIQEGVEKAPSIKEEKKAIEVIKVEYKKNQPLISDKVNFKVIYPKDWDKNKFFKDGSTVNMKKGAAERLQEMGIGKIVK